MIPGPACPLCGSTAAKNFVRTWKEFKLWDCPDCGTGYCEPFAGPGPAYYEAEKATYSALAEEQTDPMSFEYDEALALLSRLPRGARVLDVGCGAGGFLHRAKKHGFSASGIDFHPGRVKALRERGFDVFEGSLPKFAETFSVPFAAVTMFQVIEHLDDPRAWLDAARRVLEPGGLLIIGTPNRDRTFDPFRDESLAAIDNPPHHLTRWSAAALARLLSTARFSVEHCGPLPYTTPLIQLILRNAVRFGLASRGAVGPAGTASSPALAARMSGLVAAKEGVLNAVGAAAAPVLRAVGPLVGLQGPVLFAVGRSARSVD